MTRSPVDLEVPVVLGLKKLNGVSLTNVTGQCYGYVMANNYMKLMKRIVKIAIENGWDVSMTSRGHYRFVSPDKTQPIIHLSGTPSDNKTYICGIAQLRRHGLPVSNR
jgi:hypothetical protein